MKQTTCKSLRGACEEVVNGETPQEMSENCKKHVISMLQTKDAGHIAAIQDMTQLSPEEQQKWFQDFAESFESLNDVC
jgi:hypothetical protein